MLSPKMRLFALTISHKHCARDPGCAMRQEYQTRSINLRKEELKLSLYAVDRIFYIENHKESTKNFIELTIEFNKDAGYRSNI